MFLKSPILTLIALILVGTGAVISIASAIAHLIQVGMVGRFLWNLIGLSLASLGVIFLLVDAYRTRQLKFKYFAVLLVGVLILMAVAFNLVNRVSF